MILLFYFREIIMMFSRNFLYYSLFCMYFVCFFLTAKYMRVRWRKKTFTIFAKNKGEWKKKNSFSSRKLFPPPVRLKMKFIWAFFFLIMLAHSGFFFACSFIIIIINAIDQWKKSSNFNCPFDPKKPPITFLKEPNFIPKQTNKN